MTAGEANDAMNLAARDQPWWLPAVGTYGIPAVLMMLWYFQVYKPDQDTRRELDRENSKVMHQMSESMTMLVDQDRRREVNMSEIFKAMQDQTRILQQIMLDQRNGAWLDPKKPGNHAVGSGG